MPTITTSALVLLSVLLVCAPAPAFGQQDPNGPDASRVRVRFGPIMLNPSITLGSIGIDDNVFNEAEDPKRDFTMTISPRTDVYLRLLGTWFTATVSEDVVWYQKYSSERHGNSSYGLAWKWPLTRLTVNTSVLHTNTSERPSYEIDARAERALNAFSAGASFRFLPSTGIEFTARKDTTDYAPTVYNGVNLQSELSADDTTLTIGVNHKLTPLTTASATVSRREDRFPFNPIRDSNKTEARLVMAFDPRALLKGSVSIGYTNLQPLSPDFPDFRGVTLAASIVYAPYEVTKLTIVADRQVQDSYDINQPYFIQTGGSLEIDQRVFRRVDVVLRGGIERLQYLDRSDVVVDYSNRTDFVVRYGAGLVYHHRPNLRIGINYDQTHRDSVIGSREFTRPLLGTFLTYDF